MLRIGLVTLIMTGVTCTRLARGSMSRVITPDKLLFSKLPFL